MAKPPERFYVGPLGSDGLIRPLNSLSHSMGEGHVPKADKELRWSGKWGLNSSHGADRHLTLSLLFLQSYHPEQCFWVIPQLPDPAHPVWPDVLAHHRL